MALDMSISLLGYCEKTTAALSYNASSPADERQNELEPLKCIVIYSDTIICTKTRQSPEEASISSTLSAPDSESEETWPLESI